MCVLSAGLLLQSCDGKHDAVADRTGVFRAARVCTKMKIVAKWQHFKTKQEVATFQDNTRSGNTSKQHNTTPTYARVAVSNIICSIVFCMIAYVRGVAFPWCVHVRVCVRSVYVDARIARDVVFR